MSMDFQSFVHIDEGALDVEWRNQPARYLEVAEAQSDAAAEVSRLVDRLESAESELGGMIRANPEMYGITKLTDPAVKEAVSSSERVKRLKDEIIEAKRTQSRLSGLLAAMDHRRRALENLVELWARNYHSEPRPISAEAREKVNASETGAVHDEIGKRLLRGRRQ